MIINYAPQDFQEPIKGCPPYLDTLGKAEWERVAAHIIHESKQVNKWVAIKKFPKPDKTRTNYASDAEMILYYNLDEMIKVGQIKKTKEGYELTQQTLEQIATKYLTAKKK